VSEPSWPPLHVLGAWRTATSGSILLREAIAWTEDERMPSRASGHKEGTSSGARARHHAKLSSRFTGKDAHIAPPMGTCRAGNSATPLSRPVHSPLNFTAQTGSHGPVLLLAHEQGTHIRKGASAVGKDPKRCFVRCCSWRRWRAPRRFRQAPSPLGTTCSPGEPAAAVTVCGVRGVVTAAGAPPPRFPARSEASARGRAPAVAATPADRTRSRAMAGCSVPPRAAAA